MATEGTLPVGSIAAFDPKLKMYRVAVPIGAATRQDPVPSNTGIVPPPVTTGTPSKKQSTPPIFSIPAQIQLFRFQETGITADQLEGTAATHVDAGTSIAVPAGAVEVSLTSFEKAIGAYSILTDRRYQIGAAIVGTVFFGSIIFWALHRKRS